MKTLKDAEAVTPEQLKAMTPPQVDELFAAVYDEYERLRAQSSKAWDDLHRAVGDKKESYTTNWSMRHSEVEKQARAQAADSPAWQVLARMDAHQAERERLDAGVWAKLTAEYNRRGRWDRIYLVTDGHAHNTTECSSCHRGEFRTPMQWMIEWSGKSEAEIIEAIKDRACTICYPKAPVNRGLKPGESALLTDAERDREAERAERARVKAERAAKKEAKAIYDKDGGPLRVYRWTQKAHQKRERGVLVNVPERSFYDTLTTLHAARGWLTDQVDPGRYNDGTHRDIGKVADAVAHKEGKTREQVIEEAKIRAKKRG